MSAKLPLLDVWLIGTKWQAPGQPVSLVAQWTVGLRANSDPTLPKGFASNVFKTGELFMAFDLINVFNITDDANLELNGAINPVFARVNGTPFLFVMGADDDGLTVFKINAKGKLKTVDVERDQLENLIPDGTTNKLDEVFGGVP